MIHFLRSADNNTIVDIETTDDDLHCVIDIREYSRLLKWNHHLWHTIVEYFSMIQEIRGLYLEGVGNRDKYTPAEFVKLVLTNVPEEVKELDLFYLED